MKIHLQASDNQTEEENERRDVCEMNLLKNLFVTRLLRWRRPAGERTFCVSNTVFIYLTQ